MVGGSGYRFSVPSFLFDGSRFPSGVDALVNYITAYIADTPGVGSVYSVTHQLRGRDLHYSCTIVADNGDEIKGGVTTDVLLRAIS